MNKPTEFFNNTFKYSLFILLSIGFLLKIIPFSIAVIKSSNELNIPLWFTDTVYGLLLLSLFSLVIPWITLSFYGEYFYTRSLNRKDIFYIFRNQHIKYLSILSIFIILSIYTYNTLIEFVNDKINFNTSFFFITLTIFISLIIAGNTNTLKKILKYALPILIISPFLRFYYINGIDISKVLFTSMWIIYLFFVYRIIDKYDDDIDLNVAGKIDDENRSLANMWLFSKEFNFKKADLNKPSIFSSFKLLISNTSNIYIQLFLIINVVILYFSIKEIYSNYTNLYNNVINENSDISFLSILGFAFVGLFILINPKYILLQVEEFLFSRAVSKSKIYINNFLFQGIFILFLALLEFVLPSISFVSGLNITNVLLVFIWLYISGEIGILLLISLFISDMTFVTLKSNLVPNIAPSLIINIVSPNINGLLVWLAAISFRVLDYLWFINKEIGFFKEYKKMIISLSRLYIPSFLIGLLFILIATYNNPYTKFINNIVVVDIDYREKISFDSVSSIFKKNKNEREQSIYDFIKNPYDAKNYLNFSRKYYIDEYYFDSVSYGSYRLKSYYSWFNREIEYLLDISESLKNTPEYNYQKSIIYKFSNNFDKAYEFANKSLEDKDNIDYLYNLADIYAHELKNKEAIEIYKQISFLLTKNNKFYRKKIPVYLNNDYENIHDYYIQYRYKPLREIANIYWFNNDYEKAIDYYAESSLKENTFFPKKNYYYLGLCDKLNEIKNLPKYYNNTNIKKSISPFNNICSGIENQFNNSTNLILDYSKYQEDKGNLNKAEELLSNINSKAIQRNLAYLSLIQAKLGKKKEAEMTINKYLSILKYHKKYVVEKSFYINNTYFYSDLYKSLLILNKDNEKTLDFAKQFIITSSNTEKSWSDIKSILNNDYINELELFKNNYIKLYSYFESNGLSLINNKSLEKATILIDKLDNKQKENYKDLIKVIDNLLS